MIKLNIHINGFYMEEILKMIEHEMSLLDDIESIEGQELRKGLGIGNLQGKGLLRFKFDYLIKHLRYCDLNCIEKSDYFYEILQRCINNIQSAVLLNLSRITCVESDSSMRIFWVFTDNENGTKIIYSFKDDEEIRPISQEEIRQQFDSGMRTLSKSREEELKTILLGTSSCSRVFTQFEIGTTTINTSTELKDKVKGYIFDIMEKLIKTLIM